MKNYRRKDIKSTRLERLIEHGQKLAENIANASEGRWPIISEMAIPLKAYIDKIESFKYELAKNWCLCKWCQMFDPENINFNHWRKELRNCIDQLSVPKVKSNADKKKHLEKYLVEWYELNDKDMVFKIIGDKFDDEHIVDKSQIYAVAKELADNINGLIVAIADNSCSTKDYINSTFN